MSNLAFVSKAIEKAVSYQLIIEHVDSNDLGEPLQSAYKSLHNIETALLKVQDDILNAIDQRRTVVFLLLDLFAAFDTVGHELLVHRPCVHYGIRGKVLAWFTLTLLDVASMLLSEVRILLLVAWCMVSLKARYSGRFYTFCILPH